MSASRKRRAVDQLSPYSNIDEDDVVSKLKPEAQQQVTERKRAKARANIGDRASTVIDTESLKGVLSNIKILSQTEDEDKLSGLNRCFLNAVTRTLRQQSNKDLRGLFRQYEVFISKINDERNVE